ncbi:hypothetical protein [Vibrio vulnificus]|uniref:hypothetical protein n=1 Tax=Vibrio vulnificus TaxID=672 RepID=UPI000CD1E116|nr:hypothetical protein [Vibrio vulnificus]POC43488.1 hypothetical protein CRN48_15725 [Vibrio vulnificus]
MQKFVAVLGLLCVPYVYAESIEGCYLVADEIWGANFHVCHIASPIEGVGGPLQMNYVDNKLVYSHSEVEYSINCELEVSFKDNSLTIRDSNHHCSEYVFYCGARVGLDKVELPKVVQDCP